MLPVFSLKSARESKLLYRQSIRVRTIVTTHMPRSLKVISRRLAHCPFYSPVGNVHAHARSRAGLETKGGWARAKTTCSRDWRERRGDYIPAYSSGRDQEPWLYIHTHTRIQIKKERKCGRWFTNLHPPLYFMLIGYDYIWENYVEFSPQRDFLRLILEWNVRNGWLFNRSFKHDSARTEN